jgi:hypothetical protein
MYAMMHGGYYGTLGAVMAMVILLCAYQAPIFSAVVHALEYHGYRASFTALILGSAAGLVGGITPALMTSLVKLTGSAYAPAYLLVIASLIALDTLGRIRAQEL